jgi:Ran GTPase-activating protein (RanGAP) involved in mRNA processing and transport
VPDSLNSHEHPLPPGRPEDEALDALRIISAALAGAKLKRLNLSDNALGEKGVRACASVLTAQVGL